MPPSTGIDPGHFFQTSNSIAQSDRKAAKAANKAGNPIRFNSKLLAVESRHPAEKHVYVAESAGNVRRVVLETGDKSHVYSGPSAPIACLAISDKEVFAGCWDKVIWAWGTETRQQTRRLLGHTDYVKSLLLSSLVAEEASPRPKTILISGGADASIIVWDLESSSKICVLKGHSRSVESLAAPVIPSSGQLDLWSAGGDREIRTWRIRLPPSTSELVGEPLIRHETNIYRIRFDDDSNMWTASADKTAKCLAAEQKWAVDTTLEHPDYVRDIVVDEEGGHVVTGCRDEDVRVWNRATGDIVHNFSGHFEEVTGLTMMLNQVVVSVSIDGTLRQWSVAPAELKKAKEEAAKAKIDQVKEEEKAETSPMLTAEEEQELAELMEDDSI